MTLFEKLDAIFNKTPLKFEEKDFDGFMVLRFLALTPAYAEISAQLSSYMYHGAMDTKQLCVLLQSILPKKPKFTAKASLKKIYTETDTNKKVHALLQKFLHCSDTQVKDFAKILRKEGVDLEQVFGVNSKDTVTAATKRSRKRPEGVSK
jgi:hypothetical protein